MKRLISIFLCGFLMLSSVGSWQAIAEDASQLYYLWDIPFGISESEFIEQAYEKTGFNFVPHPDEVEDSYKIATNESQSISFLGHPLSGAEATFQVDSDGNPSYQMITLVFDVESKTIPEALSLFDSVRLVLEEKYGDHTLAWLYNDKGRFLTCDAIEGGFDAQQVSGILTTDDTVRMMEMVWKNLGIVVGKTSENKAGMILLSSFSIVELPEPLEVYENRNKPSDAGL